MSRTKYEIVASQMVKDYDELFKLYVENNCKVPSRIFGEKYKIDKVACRDLFLGIKAMKEHIGD